MTLILKIISLTAMHFPSVDGRPFDNCGECRVSLSDRKLCGAYVVDFVVANISQLIILFGIIVTFIIYVSIDLVALLLKSPSIVRVIDLNFVNIINYFFLTRKKENFELF